jgi:hypothetical protein
MPARLPQRAFLFLLVSAWGAGIPAAAQNDVALNAYWTFSGATTGDGTTQTPNYTAGALIELRHIAHPLIGYEATYSFNRDNQSYVATSGPSAGPPTAVVSANANEIAGAWVFSGKPGDLRPFAVAGGGVILDVPTSATYYPCGINREPQCTAVANPPASTSVKPVFVYGGGIDCVLSPHVGLRIQYRGNLAKAAALTSVISSSGALTHTAEPMMGAYFRF